MEKGWTGLPYHSIGEHFKRVFGKKVYKIPVTVVDDCPNRMGLKGMKTCSFCDVWGSAAREESFQMSLNEQIIKYKNHISKKYNADSFLIYFQAYTNTFTKVAQLKENFETALSFPYVSGFVIGTRPDCLSESVLNLWQSYCQKTFVAVELGVQSFNNVHLEFMRRGHSAQDSLKAIDKISSKTSVDLGIHLIFGSPGETLKEIKDTALMCNDLPISNVKLHNLHVLKNTELERLFMNGSFNPISFEEYQSAVEEFISYLHPRISVQRLAAYSSRWNELVAPSWTADKMGPHQKIIDHMRDNKVYQGCKLTAHNEEDRLLINQMKMRVERSFGS
jgi:radical SAM protein (TIGR01212 family)